MSMSVGDTVYWKNDGEIWHTVTSGEPKEYNGKFDSGRLNPGEIYKHTFTRAGDFHYYCRPHPWMTGMITVR